MATNLKKARALYPGMVSLRSEVGTARQTFLNGIGASPFGLGPLSYVLGADPEQIDLSVQLDNAIGGLFEAGGARGVDKPHLPTGSQFLLRKK